MQNSKFFVEFSKRKVKEILLGIHTIHIRVSESVNLSFSEGFFPAEIQQLKKNMDANNDLIEMTRKS